MSWLRIDDGFEDHEKVEGLSDAAHRLWFRCACWCKRQANERLGGLVPRRQVVKFCGGDDIVAQELAQELVEAVGDEVFGHEFGLWEARDGGWQFHDWQHYQPAQKEPATPERRAEAARQAGLKSAESRRKTHGTARPIARTDSERPPNGPTNALTNESPNGSRTENRSQSVAAPRTDRERIGNGFQRPEPPGPDPDPVPTPGPLAAGSQDLLADRARPEEPAAAAGPIDPITHKYQLAQRTPGWFAMEGGINWPEFREVWFAWCKPFGITEPPRITQRIDRDITAIIDAFASGKPLELLLLAGKRAETDEYMQRQENGGPASFTSAVLMRLLKAPRLGGMPKRRGGPPQPDAGVDPFAKHDAKQGAS